MEEIVKVGIADWKLCKKPDRITTIGLGSCVGIVLYSDHSDYCGMVHIMLPSSKEIKNNQKRAKFADTGIEDLVRALESKGVRQSSLSAKIAGGATMFQFAGNSDLGSIGDRNIKAVKEILSSYRIRIVAEDTGADYGRTIVFDNSSKQLLIRSTGKPDKII
ncbi:MAG: chemotaxis protein CheD [Lachnospiraceae bacterium]|nr:chemotaxis protein CheD [Lachnospiraceae bacterium]